MSQWKKTALDNLSALFVDDRKAAKQQEATASFRSVNLFSASQEQN